MNIDSKLPDVGTTIFTVISALAQQQGAINLGQGFPDYDGPDYLRERLAHYVNEGFNQYPPMIGVEALREQIALKVQRLYDRQVSTDAEVTVVPGATEALFCAIMACVKSGDEVIVFDPAYDSYEPAVQLAGGKTIHLALQPPQFSIDWQQVKDAINPRTRMIIINSPHNPAGSVLSAQDLATLAELVRNTNILILADEVYEHLVYDDLSHQSMLLHDELYQRAFVVSSFGKTFHVTGWKTGYCVAPPLLSAELRKVHQFVTFVGVTPIQWALADFMKTEPEYCLTLSDFYQNKRDLFCNALSDSGFQVSPSSGTYFQLADYSQISDKQDQHMAEWLTKEVKVAAIPISVFCEAPFEHRYVRFCFAKQDDTLLEAAARLSHI
ncbi:MAG: pyridoxal phosphate-dependent aminotransferase [Pseudomonadales bacterium]